MVAPIMGPTLGGWITDNWNWRWNFYINVPIGAIAVPDGLRRSCTTRAYLRERRARGGHVDYSASRCLVLGLGLMQIVLDRGQRADWFNSAWVCTCTAASAAALIILDRSTSCASRIRSSICASSRYRPSDLSVMLIVAMSFALYGTGLLNPIFLQELMGYTAWKSRTGAGAARARHDGLDAADRAARAPRLRYPSAGRRSASC